jgi:hypothetical protein
MKPVTHADDKELLKLPTLTGVFRVLGNGHVTLNQRKASDAATEVESVNLFSLSD